MIRISLVPFLAVAALAFTRPAFAHGDLDRQIADLSAKIEAELRAPLNGHRRAKLHFVRGELYRLQRNWNAAESDFQQAARYQPELESVTIARARLWLESDRPERARQALEVFLDGHPAHPEALYLHAQVLVKLGWGARAVSFVDRALGSTAQPEPDHYLARAEILVGLGPDHLDAAVAGLDEGIRRLGPLVSLDSRAIDLEIARGRWDRALARIDRQAAATVRKDVWLARKAEVLDRAGRREQARAARREALAVIAGLPPTLQARPATSSLAQQLRAGLGEGANR